MVKYSDLAPKLFDNGWRNLLPLTGVRRKVNGVWSFDRKGTKVKWREMQFNLMTEASLEWLVSRYGYAPAIGIVFGRCHGIVGIDIDVEEEESVKRVMKAADDFLPPTPFKRYGKPPKVLLLYSGLAQSRKHHPIEIFASSCQTVAFGMHNSGRMYQWPEASIEECGPEDLPRIDESQIAQFLKHCERNVRVYDRKGNPVDWVDWEKLAIERQQFGLDGAARQLRDVTAGSRHNTLLSVIGWLATRMKDDEIYEFVNAWFPDAMRTEEYMDLDAVIGVMLETQGKWDPDWELKDDEEASG